MSEEKNQEQENNESSGSGHDELAEAAETLAEGEGAQKDVVDTEEQLRDDILRLSADLENLKKNVLTETAEARRRATAEAIRALTPAMNALDVALRTMREETQNGDLADWREGVEKVRDLFEAAMLELGAVPIPTDGSYDPKFHEAVEKVPGEQYQIVDVVGLGWMWKDDQGVIVPAKVHVGSGE